MSIGYQILPVTPILPVIWAGMLPSSPFSNTRNIRTERRWLKWWTRVMRWIRGPIAIVHRINRATRIHRTISAVGCNTDPFGAGSGSVNKTKMIKRQMFGRAGFELLRHRILLG